MAVAEMERQHQPVRPVCRVRGRGAGGGARAAFPEDADRAGAARGGRRSPGGARGRHPAAAHLGDRVGGRRLRRAGGRRDVGRAQRRAVRADVRRAEGAAGTDPGRLRIDPRRHHRRADHRRGREARRGLPRALCRRRHRELVRVRDRAAVPAGAAGRPVRREAHRPGLRATAMLYREAGQFKSTYAEDQQIFPIRQDRIALAVFLAFALLVVPVIGNQYWLGALLTPFLIFSLAALGLNILTGYAGQLSLGTAAFMAVGAFMAYNFVLRVPGIPILLAFVLAGICAAAVGIVFGLPSLRIKGFYLAVATLACQFFVLWALNRVGWFSNYSSSGVITAQRMDVFGYPVDTPATKYLLTLAVVALMALAAKNLMRSETGRAFMAVRDMDVAASVIGIPMMRTKLLAFAISSFYCGVAGALHAFCYLGTVEPEAYSLDLSFRILFMIIIGGVGSILGAFLGAAFITLFPIFLSLASSWVNDLFGVEISHAVVSNLESIIFGGLIIFFLIVEPQGLARLWQITKEKLRLWPFPH